MFSITDRHQFILDRLQQEGMVSVLALCRELDVSSVTIRKDLKILEDKNLLFRIHGGGTLRNPYTVDRPVNEKEKIRAAEKNRIGAAGAALVQPNDSIIIGSGTSVLALARNIHPRGSLMVITAALNVALELLRHPQVEVLQLGGHLRKTSSSSTGSYAEDMLKDFSCSKLFLGADGIDLEFGLTTADAMEAYLNRKMIEAAQRTIVLADSTKFGRKGFGKICPMENIEQIITDSGVSEHTVKALEEMGIKVTIV